MARTNIKVFDEGYKNIMNDDEYNLSVQRTRGVTPGIADPLMHNKLYRQVSVMSTALAQYIVDQGYDCLDTDLTEIAGNIKNATIKTMLDRLKEGNLILGDGITANGNFTINRKLTVNEIDCKTGLTIGGQKPLDSSAIEKLQAQIISPSQKIFVDGKNGNDNNDGSVYNKPVKTLDKAVSLIKKYTTSVEIELKTYIAEADVKYNTYTISAPIDNKLFEVDYFRIHGIWENYRTHDVVANIIIPYGSSHTQVWKYTNNVITGEYKWWGWFLFDNFNSLDFYCVNFVFPDEASSDLTKYKNSIIRNLNKSLSFGHLRGNTLTLKENSSFISTYSSPNIDLISIGSEGTIDGNGILLSTGYSYSLYTHSPKDTDGGDSIPVERIGSMIITKYVVKNIKLAGNVLNNNKGMGAGVKAIYTDVL